MPNQCTLFLSPTVHHFEIYSWYVVIHLLSNLLSVCGWQNDSLMKADLEQIDCHFRVELSEAKKVSKREHKSKVASMTLIQKKFKLCGISKRSV